MRILMVSPRFLPETGGVEMHAYQVSQRLISLGQSVTVLTSDRSRQLPEQESNRRNSGKAGASVAP